jgi:hypothetical protein
VTAGGVRINCIGLVGLRHLLYKGVADPLGFQGVRHPWCRLPWVPPLLEAPPLVPPPLEPALGGLLPYKCNLSPINRGIQFYSYSSPLTGGSRGRRRWRCLAVVSRGRMRFRRRRGGGSRRRPWRRRHCVSRGGSWAAPPTLAAATPLLSLSLSRGRDGR